MNETPKRGSTTPHRNIGYSPLTLPQSPAAGSTQKNLTGLPRVARDIVTDLYNLIQHWNDNHVTGAKIVKEIAVLKANRTKSYPPQLEEYTNQLFNVIQILESYKERFEGIITQIKAFEKLRVNDDPLFISLDTSALTNAIVSVAEAYIGELKFKELVFENIAHSKNDREALAYATCWTHQKHLYSIGEGIGAAPAEARRCTKIKHMAAEAIDIV
ncbi:hypothetical protein NQ315_009988 [Exocentrus adspersus]|uniref:Uncharacterized protein n=1 Tax=Exocentrus adspersus TaxID=1586481 RepID=A0AAV8WI42_9CUCU|nr:hypothetical protein NQ315_009988 [Exocentrus adspersus]